jgi:hypothetical protein
MVALPKNKQNARRRKADPTKQSARIAQAAEKVVPHSERSEKSLFGNNPRKERFIAPKACDGAEILTPQTPFGMTGMGVIDCGESMGAGLSF